MGRFDRVRNAIQLPAMQAEELIRSDPDAEPEGYAGDERSTGLVKGGLLEHDPPTDDLDDYWNVYKNHTIVESSINNFASEVIEPGWFITADSDETAEELTEFMSEVAILNLQTGENFSTLAEQLVIEREVRGTAFVEKVKDNDGNWTALYPLQNDTITVYTKPGKAMLPAPDDDVADPHDAVDVSGPFRTPRTDDGKTGAYVQFDDIKPYWQRSDHDEVVYTRDQVIHWPRDPDIGSARGTSRIRRIVKRAEGLLQKLDDNDTAIKTKAWPHIIFNLGTEDNPWTLDEAREFMSDYEEEKLGPGMMNAVAGDVSIEEFAGETADIADSLDFDVNWIMSGLPGPVYATGGFAQNVAPAVVQAQERVYLKEVRKVRRELESKFTPFLREVAEQHDLDAPDSVQLHISRPGNEVAPEDVQGSIINYRSESPQGDGGGDDGEGDPTRGSTGPNTGQTNINPEENESTPSFRTAELESVEELADPRLVSSTEHASSISDTVSDTMQNARDLTIQRLRSQFEGSPVSASSSMDSVARRVVEQTLSTVDVANEVESDVESVVQDTLDTIGQDNHPIGETIPFGVRHRQRSRELASGVSTATRQAVEDMLDDLAMQVRTGAQNGESIDAIIERVENQWSDEVIDSRADIIGHMEVQNAINSTKLVEYDRSPEVDGIQVINSCGRDVVPICRDLAGCAGEEPAVAWFDADETVSEQFESQTSENLHVGFDPLPSVPPFHMGCTSEIVAVTRD